MNERWRKEKILEKEININTWLIKKLGNSTRYSYNELTVNKNNK